MNYVEIKKAEKAFKDFLKGSSSFMSNEYEKYNSSDFSTNANYSNEYSSKYKTWKNTSSSARSYLDYLKDSISEEDYNSYLGYFDSFDKGLSDLASGYENKTNLYSNFESKEQYDRYQKAATADIGELQKKLEKLKTESESNPYLPPSMRSDPNLKVNKEISDTEILLEQARDIQYGSKYADMSYDDIQLVLNGIVPPKNEKSGNIVSDRINEKFSKKTTPELANLTEDEREWLLNNSDSFKTDAEKSKQYQSNKLLLKKLNSEGFFNDWKLKDQLQIDVDRYEAERAAKNTKAFAETAPITASAYSVLTSPLNALGAVDAVARKATGRQINPYSTLNRFGTTNSNIRKYVSEDMSDVGSFVYNTAMSIGDSAVAIGLGGLWGGQPLTQAIMSGSAASNTILSAKERGISDGGALLSGIAAGAAEWFFEKYSLESLDALTSNGGAGLKNGIMNFLNQSFTEGSEEFFTEIANAISDSMINGELSELSVQYKNLVKNGYSPEEASSMVAAGFGQQILEAFAGGVLSGGVFGLVGSVTNSVYNRSEGNRLVDANLQKKVLDTAADFDPKSQTGKRLSEYNKKVGGDNVNAPYLGAVYRTMSQETQEAIAKEMERGKRPEAETKGETESLDKTYALAEKVKGIEKEYGKRVVASESAKKYSVSEDGAKVRNFVVESDGKVLVNDGTKTVPATEAKISQDASTALAYSEDMSPKMKESFFNNYENFVASGKMSLDEYHDAFTLSYLGGLRARSFDEVAKSTKYVLSEGETMDIYKEGLELRGQIAKEGQDLVASANKELGNKNLLPGKVDDSVVRYQNLRAGDRRHAMVGFGRFIAATTGRNITFFDSTKEERESGKENGYYDPDTNTLYIDINAGVDETALVYEDCLMITLSHELVHQFAIEDSDGYALLADLVFESLTKETGKTKAQLIEAEVNRINEVTPKRFEGKSEKVQKEIAQEEIVARACEERLGDSRLAKEFVAEMENKDSSLVQKFSNFLGEAIDKIKAIFEKIFASYRSNTEEAAAIRKQINNLSKIQEQFDALLERRGDVSSLTKNTSDRGVMMQVRKEFSQDLQEWFDTTTHEQRKVSGKRFLVGSTTEVLKSIGVKDYNIYFGGSKIDKILTDNSSMSLETIKNAVMLLEDPILIMESLTVEDSIVIFGEVFAENEKPVMISVLLNPKTKAGEVLDYAVITSSYGRRANNLQNLINHSKIYYINEQKNRTDKWLKALGLHLPSALTKYGSIGSISNQIESVKREQLEIINETNPAPNSYNTWIRSVEDIRTWEEVLELDDEREGQFVWGDFSRSDAEEALKDGTITVYSSHPIQNGVFVSTSRVQAQEYAGGRNETVYSKTVPITDVAWINGDEGQYAKVTSDNANDTKKGIMTMERGSASDKNDEIRNQERVNDFQERVIAAQDMADEARQYGRKLSVNYDGSVTVYHGTSAENAEKIRTTGTINKQSFFTTRKSEAEYYAKQKNKNGVVLEFHVDARNLEFAAAGAELYSPVELTNANGIYTANEDRRFQERDADQEYMDAVNGESDDIRYQERTPYRSSRDILLAYAEEARNTKVRNEFVDEYVARVEDLDRKVAQLESAESKLALAVDSGNAKDEKFFKERVDNLTKSLNRIQKDLSRMEASNELKGIVRREKAETRKQAKKEAREELYSYKDEQERKNRISRIQAKTKLLAERILNNNKESHVPDYLKKPVADFITAIDFSSKRKLKGGEETLVGQRYTDLLTDVKAAIEKNQKDAWMVLDLDDSLVQKIEELAEQLRGFSVEEAKLVLNEMETEQLRDLDLVLTGITRSLNSIDKAFGESGSEKISVLAEDSIEYMQEMEAKKKSESGLITKLVTWKSFTPYTAFQRFGKGGERIYNSLLNGWGKYAKLAKQIIDFSEETWTSKESKNWTTKVVDVELAGQSFKITKSQMMYLYLVNKRDQGIRHLDRQGFQVDAIPKVFGEKESDVAKSKLIKSSKEQRDKFFDRYMPEGSREREVADSIQHYMVENCAKWGNEISMKRWGYRAFTDPDYVPLFSEKSQLPSRAPEATNFNLHRILNLGFTKSLNAEAGNALLIYDIFDVFSEHSSDMAKYHSLGLPILDAVRWLNYRTTEYNDFGEPIRGDDTMRSVMEETWGEDAYKYVSKFLSDLNGATKNESDFADNAVAKLARNYKIASVAANLKVALLQPTSYFRASKVISWDSLTRAVGLVAAEKVSNGKRAEKYSALAEKYSGMALWKSLGFFDVNISKGLGSKIKHEENVRDKIVDLSMKGAEYGDRWTLAVLFKACHLELSKRGELKGLTKEQAWEKTGELLDQVIVQTQVVDSTITRSDLMRGSTYTSRALTAFMSEPTVSLNILVNSVFDVDAERRKGKTLRKALSGKAGKALGRSMATYGATALAASLIESFAKAWRDDDEDPFVIDFLKEIPISFYENVSIVQKIPLVKEVVSLLENIFKGTSYGSDRMEYEAINTVVKAIQKAQRMVEKEDYSMETLYSVVSYCIKATSYLTGIAASNLERELVSIWNNTFGEAFDMKISKKKQKK